jgi:MerR family transcriptional regulator, redox-sensitive transcriptional activator SoxR
MPATRHPVTGPHATDLLTVGEIARRSGFAQSAVRYYDGLGLLAAFRTAGGQRRFRRSSLRRLALIAAARSTGLGLDVIAEALACLPRDRAPARADWAEVSDGLGKRLNEQISALEALRDQLTGCVGCGCMSLDNCSAANPADFAGADGPGAVYLPDQLRRPDTAGRRISHHRPRTANATRPTWPVCCLRLTGTTRAAYCPAASPDRVTLTDRAVLDST